MSKEGRRERRGEERRGDVEEMDAGGKIERIFSIAAIKRNPRNPTFLAGHEFIFSTIYTNILAGEEM